VDAQHRIASSTEQVHPDSGDLDLCSVAEIVRRLHEEDRVAVEAVGQVLPQIAAVAEAARGALSAGGRLVYVGAGTSGRLGVVDAAECPPTFGSDPGQVVAVLAGGPDAMTHAVEGAEDDSDAGARAVEDLGVCARDLVVGISASARTPFVMGALRASRTLGAHTALLCCNPDAADPQAAELLIAPRTGSELVAGSTRLKAGTATKLILNALSTAAFTALGRVYRGRMISLRVTNEKLAARARRMVQELAGISSEEASVLLAQAGGSPRLALAMHFTGLPADDAARKLEERGLRSLETNR
jgi:N-acetylmuramic acid 6-phosphate etherase